MEKIINFLTKAQLTTVAGYAPLLLGVGGRQKGARPEVEQRHPEDEHEDDLHLALEAHPHEDHRHDQGAKHCANLEEFENFF